MPDARIVKKGLYLRLDDPTQAPSPRKTPPYRLYAWLMVGVFTLLRIFFADMFLLVPDETNYWQWGRYLDWGYHDQAPLIGWAIRFSTAFFGPHEWAVRLPSILAGAVVSAYLIRISERWFDTRTAFLTTLATQSILLFHVGALLATPDGLQAAAWAGAAYHTARAYENAQWKQWLAAGLWFGLGLLSKFTMIIFAGCAFLYGMTTSFHRERLMEIRAYIGVFIGFLLFTPVIYWNAIHDWNSVRHVAFIGGANEEIFFRLRFLGDFIGSQAALLSPLIFLLIVTAWWRTFDTPFQPGKWLPRYLCFTSFPMIAGFMLLSFHARVYGNWPGAGYLTASILIAFWYGRNHRPAWDQRPGGFGQKLWPWALVSSAIFSVLVLAHTVYPFLPLPVRVDRIASETLGWKELGEKTKEMAQTMPDLSRTFIFGLNYQTASELAFYVPGQPATVSINRWERPNVYDYWWKDEDLLGWDAVGVTYDPISHETRLHQVFERVDPPEEIRVYRQPVIGESEPAYVKSFYLYRAYGFRGGLRWVPENASDIRVGNPNLNSEPR